MNKIIHLTRMQPAERRNGIETIKDALRAGKLVILPTETVHGLTVRADLPQAVARLFAVKERPVNRHLAFLVPAPDCITDKKFGQILDAVQPIALKLAKRFWPGALTIVVPGTTPHQSHYVLPNGDNLSTIGFRMPNHQTTLEIIDGLEFPVYATSANISGKEKDTMDHKLREHVDFIVFVEDEKPPEGISSTVLELRYGDGKIAGVIHREGTVTGKEISDVFQENALPPVRRKRKIVFVCSGNTCRSPMAEYLCKYIVARRENISSEKLAGYEIISCGTSAVDGIPVFQSTIDAMADFGIDISEHRSRRMRREDLIDADLILVMTQMHLQRVRDFAPELYDKIELVDLYGKDIGDPFEGSVIIYRNTAEQIKKCLTERMDEL